MKREGSISSTGSIHLSEESGLLFKKKSTQKGAHLLIKKQKREKQKIEKHLEKLFKLK